MKEGFTLIELLVVVLIIGILTAIALPQYQTAVDKADYMQLVSDVDAIRKAEEAYFMANGDYTSDLNALDITLTGLHQRNATDISEHTHWRGNKGYISLKGAIWRGGEQGGSGTKSLSNIFAASTRSGAVYFVYLDHADKDGVKPSNEIRRQCLPRAGHARSLRLCKSMGKPCEDNMMSKGVLVDPDTGTSEIPYCF